MSALLLGSPFALCCTVMIEAWQRQPARLSQLVGVPLSALDLNSTSHALFMAAPLLIGFAVIRVPRLPGSDRLSRFLHQLHVDMEVL